MAAEGTGFSDERIGEALIKEMIEGELQDVPSDNVPSLSLLVQGGQSVQEKMVVEQVATLIKKIGDRMRKDKEFQQFNDAVDALAHSPGNKWGQFQQVAHRVFDDSVTWEKIGLLFFAAGLLAVKLVMAQLPQFVLDFAKWILDFYRERLLGWIRSHGGWINSFSDLAVAPLRKVSEGPVCGGLLFLAGITLGCLLTWKLMQRQQP